MNATYTITKSKSVYGECDVIHPHPTLRTAVQAAKEIGISTRKFGYMWRALPDCSGVVLAGTEKNKYATVVYTPEQVARIAEAAPRYDGNGRLKA